jgi:DNA-binding NarL/FixJ family response regulator
MRRKAVIVDEDHGWRESLQQILESDGFEVPASAENLRSVLPLLREHSPDLLVTEFTNLDLISEIRSSWHDLRIVVTSNVREPSAIESALASGVNVYVFKTTHPSDIASALRQAFEVTFILMPSTFGGAGAAEEPPSEDRVREAGLTRREVELLAYIAGGSSNREIAKALWVTEQTVKFHLSNIYRKLGVSNRTEASHWAHTHGIPPSPPNTVTTNSLSGGLD